MGPWVLQGQVQPTGRLACLVLRVLSDRWAHQERRARRARLAGPAPSAPTEITVPLARPGCLPCTDTGKISGAPVLSCRTSRRTGGVGGPRAARWRADGWKDGACRVSSHLPVGWGVPVLGLPGSGVACVIVRNTICFLCASHMGLVPLVPFVSRFY